MTEPVPTLYIDGPPDPGDTDHLVVNAALQAAIVIFNSLPSHLIGRYVASITLTMCMANHNPAAALEGLYRIVGERIGLLNSKPEGSG